jgi:hypothetical protein
MSPIGCVVGVDVSVKQTCSRSRQTLARKPKVQATRSKIGVHNECDVRLASDAAKEENAFINREILRKS